MNNSVLVKTIQNNKKQRDIRYATNGRTRNRLTTSVNFKGSKYILDFFQIFEIKKIKWKWIHKYLSVNQF